MNEQIHTKSSSKKIDNSNRERQKHFARFHYTTKPYSFSCIASKVICAETIRKKRTQKLERYTF